MLVKVGLIILSSLFLVSYSLAGDLRPACGGIDCSWCYFFQDIKEALDFFIYDVSFPLGGLMIVIGGILYMFGGASKNLVNRGKDLIKYAFLGVFIVFISWTLVSLIMKFLLNDPNINPWSGITC